MILKSNNNADRIQSRSENPSTDLHVVQLTSSRFFGGPDWQMLELAKEIHIVPEKHYVETDGTEDMAEALSRCIDNPQAIREMPQLGHTTVVEHYSWPVLADKLETVWKNTCGRN